MKKLLCAALLAPVLAFANVNISYCDTIAREASDMQIQRRDDPTWTPQSAYETLKKTPNWQISQMLKDDKLKKELENMSIQSIVFLNSTPLSSTPEEAYRLVNIACLNKHIK